MKTKLKYILASTLTVSIIAITSCGDTSKQNSSEAPPPVSMVEEALDPMENPGIGPIKTVVLGAEVDVDMAKEGEEYYQQLCTACHKPDQKYIGPSPAGIMERRSPAWIMNMILNPEEMVLKDPIAKDLLIEYNGAPMANQNLTEDQARAILEYFRTL